MKENDKILIQPIESQEGNVVIGKIQNIDTEDRGPTIKKGRVGSVTIYEVKENELETLERGSPNSIYLNFGIALISIGLSFLITLLTVELKDKIIVFTVFALITIVTLIIGFFLMVIWYRSNNDIKTIFKEIRARLQE